MAYFDKCPEIQVTYFPIMNTFYKFLLKIETSCAKKVLKSILEIWNANDVTVYVGFVYFWIK